MTDPKKPPNIPARIEADVGRDLRAVGGFFKGLYKLTQRAERVVKTATEPEEPRPAESVPIPRPIARTASGVEVLPKCDVCGDKREVGEGRKIPCPACVKR